MIGAAVRGDAVWFTTDPVAEGGFARFSKDAGVRGHDLPG